MRRTSLIEPDVNEPGVSNADWNGPVVFNPFDPVTIPAITRSSSGRGRTVFTISSCFGCLSDFGGLVEGQDLKESSSFTGTLGPLVFQLRGEI